MSAPACLAPRDRERLVSVLNLLSSDKAGERDAAGLAACRLLRARGLGWSDVVVLPAKSADDTVPWRSVVEQCLASPHCTPWERSFLESLCGFRRLSEKQHAVLSRIAAKAGVG